MLPTLLAGVSFDKQRKRWVASITHNGKRIFIGRFHDKEDAVAARLNAEVHLFGEFSPQWEKEIAS